MKKTLLGLVISFFLTTTSSAQIICIFCYDQNDSISTGVNNLVANGGFENTTCIPWGGGGFDSYCPNSMYYGCDISNWTCTGGGTYSYPVMFDGVNGGNIAEGIRGAYFGNGFASFCSSFQSDTLCISDSGCTVIGIPPGYPTNDANLGGALGINLSQTVNGLIPGNIYILEFWAGGEGSTYTDQGIFGVDIGFGYTFLRCPSTNPNVGIGRRFIIEFYATSASHTLKFTSWGHKFGIGTELILDDVRLYTLAELSPSVPSCLTGLPSASFTSPSLVCPGTCIDFVNSSQNASAYTWIFPGGNPGTSSDINPTSICYNAPGQYDVTLIATSGLNSDTLELSNYITVHPFPPPQGILQNGDTLFANAGAFSYQWYFNANQIPGATDYFYVATQSGNYNVVTTDSNDCEVEAGILNVIAGNSQLTVGNGQLAIFPNPVTGMLYVDGYKLFGTAVELSVYNVLGEEIKLPVDYEEMSVDCSSLLPGIYFLDLKTRHQFYYTRFVKAK